MSNIQKAFNISASGVLLTPPLTLSNEHTSLLITVQNQTVKYLHGITASSFLVSTFPYAIPPFAGNEHVLQRLVVCTGNLAVNSNNDLVSDPTPDGAVFPDNASRIIIDQWFRDDIAVNFTKPIIVLEGEWLNICVGRGWVSGDVSYGITPIYSTLTALGEESLTSPSSFPYSTR